MQNELQDATQPSPSSDTLTKRRKIVSSLDSSTATNKTATTKPKKKQEFREQIDSLQAHRTLAEIVPVWSDLLGITANPKLQYCSSACCANTAGIHTSIMQGLARLGFLKPTPIQRAVVPQSLNGEKDILVAAATGSGKTLSFGIPIVNDLLHYEKQLEPCVQALVLTPTRELAIQIESHLLSLLQFSTLQVVSIVGGMSEEKQTRLLQSCPEIIVATPGRLWALMQQVKKGDSAFKFLCDLSQLRFLVLDEADRLLSSNHFAELKHLLACITGVWNETTNTNPSAINSFLEDAIEQPSQDVSASFTPFRRQIFVVSATLTLESVNRNMKTESKTPIYDNLMRLVPIRDNPSIIDLTPRHRTNQLVAQYRILSDEDDKDTLLYSLVYSFHCQNMQGKKSIRTIVFANTIGTVKRVSTILQQLKFNVWCLHAQQQQKQRLKNLDRFISGNNTILVCSDVAARGLDIPSIDYVIHFNVPLSAEDYIHRTGRVVRQVSSAADIPAGNEHKEEEKKGVSVLMISPKEVNMYHKILGALKIPQGIAKYNVNERVIPLLRTHMKVAKDIANIISRQLKKKRQMGDLKRLADAADIDLDEINVPKKMKKLLQDEEQTPDQKQLKALQLKLDEMLNSRQLDIDRPKSTYLTKMQVE